MQKIFEQSVAFAFQKGSRWKKVVSALIHQYKNNGLLDNIRRKYLASDCRKEDENQPIQFGILYLNGACIVLVFGIGFSILVFVCEHLINGVVKKLKIKRSSSYTFSHDVETDMEHC